MLDRRTFLGTAGAVLVTGPLRLLAQNNRIETVGLQLYTVRDEMAKDFEGTLAKVAAIGYKEVEFAGYFNKTARDVRAVLDRHGLTAPATHVDFKSLRENLPQVLETAGIIGHRYIVLPWLDDATLKEPDIWKRVADTLNAAAAAGSKSAIQAAYHNHHFEFAPVGGQLPYDVLLETCDPAVKMELDLCWITAAGKDPVAYFRRYPGRFPMVHVKDLKKIPAGPTPGALPIGQILPDVADVGSGTIDWKRIFAESKTAGIRHYFVEHDRPARTFESLEASYKYLQALRF
jgi:sugar phosphate isomerase/epimerase